MKRKFIYLLFLCLCTQQMLAKDYEVQTSEKTWVSPNGFDITLPEVPCAKLSFEAGQSKVLNFCSGNTEVAYNNNVFYVIDGSSMDKNGTYYKFENIEFPEAAVGGKLRFQSPVLSTGKRKIRNVVVTQARYLRFADKTKEEKTLEFCGYERTIAIDYSDVSVVASIDGENASFFKIAEDDKSFGDNNGAYEPNKEIKVTFTPSMVGDYNAILTLTAANGDVIKVNLKAHVDANAGNLEPSDEGWFSFGASYNYEVPVGILAYTGLLNGDKIELTEVAAGSVIKGGQGIVFKGQVGTNYEFLTNLDKDPINQPNDFAGSSEAVTVDQNQNDYYILASAKDMPKAFYHYTGTNNLAANKAYICKEKTAANNAPRVLTLGDEEVTGIQALPEAEGLKTQGTEIYNLSGQRIQKMQRGVNIIGGKKVLK